MKIALYLNYLIIIRVYYSFNFVNKIGYLNYFNIQLTSIL